MNFLISLVVGLMIVAGGLIAPSEQFFQSNQTSDELTPILHDLLDKHLKAVQTNLIQPIDEFASKVEMINSKKDNEKIDETMLPEDRQLIEKRFKNCLNELESYMMFNGEKLIIYQELIKQQQEQEKSLVDECKLLMVRWINQLQYFLNWELKVFNNQNYDWSDSTNLLLELISQKDSIVKLEEHYSNGQVSNGSLSDNDNINKIIELHTEIMKILDQFASLFVKKIDERFVIKKSFVINKKKPIVKKSIFDNLKELIKEEPHLKPIFAGGTLVMMLILTGLGFNILRAGSNMISSMANLINDEPRIYGTTQSSSNMSPEWFYMCIILVLIFVVVCTIVTFFLYRKMKSKSKLNKDNKELKNSNYHHHRSYGRHSSRFPSHHRSRFGRSSAFENRMEPIHAGDKHHRRMSSIPSNVPSSRMSSIQSNVPNSRMSPPIPNNPTYIILPPFQSTGPNYRIPSKANVEQYNRISPIANAAPNLRIPSTTNDGPNLRIPSTTNDGPNLRISSNTNVGPNLKIPPTTNVGPNLKIPPTTNDRPNLRMPSNTKVGPNLSMPSNTKVGPNLRMPSNTKVGPNLRMPSNTKVGPNLSMPSNPNVGPNLSMPSNTNVGPNLSMPTNTNVGPNLSMPSNTNVGPNLSMPSNTNVGPNLRMLSNTKVGPKDKNH